LRVDPPGPQAPLDLERSADKLQQMQSLWQQYGDCYRVHAASRPADTWVITEPDWVRRILVSNHRNYVKGIGIERVRVLLGNGLMTSENAQWRRQRRLMQSAFHKPRVERFFGIFFQQAKMLAERCLQAANAGQAVNITEAVSEATLRVTLQALFSEDLDSLENRQGQSAFQLLSDDSRRDLQFAVRFRALGTLVQDVVQDRRRQQRFPDDLLSHCLLARDKSSNEPMTDRQIIDEVLTLIVAGHETTAASLGWVWYLLATHPERFEALRETLRHCDPGAVRDWTSLVRLQTVMQVLKEALRLYPPGWLYTRRALQDDRFGDYHMPAGTDVFVNSWLLHRHPGYWEQPDEFRPERFTPDQEARRHRYAYLPFSAGPRHCIGESFAMAEMMIHLAVMARTVQPEPIHGTSVAVRAEINLRPRDPLYLRFAPVGTARV
jgi:cytochrome P450